MNHNFSLDHIWFSSDSAPDLAGLIHSGGPSLGTQSPIRPYPHAYTSRNILQSTSNVFSMEQVLMTMKHHGLHNCGASTVLTWTALTFLSPSSILMGMKLLYFHLHISIIITNETKI
ncbi:hypothetical protein V6N12_073516 [Hibiscus sabdariffa]|uniref:Uncharacterized protein n=1 Tax=Hibiscus sabdariffa TaxID=183260 RepID=A0ABR2BHN7_9ROSI